MYGTKYMEKRVEGPDLKVKSCTDITGAENQEK